MFLDKAIKLPEDYSVLVSNTQIVPKVKYDFFNDSVHFDTETE